MAIKIEKGGWVLIFLIGLALVFYSLNKYGVLDLVNGLDHVLRPPAVAKP